MGYSVRYHAASLAAVFIALAIGILIGSQFGGDLLNRTRQDLEKSLTSDLDASRAEVKTLKGNLDSADEFGTAIFPLVVDSQLQGRRIGVIGMGEMPGDVTEAVEQAIKPSGGRLVAFGAVRQPPSLSDLDRSLSGTRYAGLDDNPARLEAYGRRIGRQLVSGGRLLESTRSELMSQSSGEFRGLDGLIVYRSPSEGLDEDEADAVDRLDDAILEGALATRAQVVGVELSGTDPTQMGFFRERNVSTVDNADMPSGKISLVYTLTGTEGNFGVKDGVSRQLPELLEPVAPRSGRRGSRD